MRLYSGNTSYRTCKKVGSFADMPHSKELESLKNKVSCLEEELRLSNLRADLWQRLIEVAEENLNIDIKKSLVPSYWKFCQRQQNVQSNTIVQHTGL